jgi:hypothetical protein
MSKKPPTLSEIMREVMALLDDLYEARDFISQVRGYDSPWEECYATTWEKLRLALAKAGSTMHDPPPDYGLAALWLRVVCRKAHETERIASESRDGYDEIAQSWPGSFMWLFSGAPSLAIKMLKVYPHVAQPLEKLAHPKLDRDPIRELRELADKADQLLQDSSGGSARSGSASLDDETMKGLLSSGEEAGKLILNCLDGGHPADDESLDEIVLFSLDQNLDAVDTARVFRILACRWLPGDWVSVPLVHLRDSWDENCKDESKIDVTEYPGCMRAIADRLAAARTESLRKSGEKTRPEAWSEIIVVDPKEDIVTVGGQPFSVSPKQKRMISLLVDADGDPVPMSKHGFSKPSDLKKKLPDKLLNLIETNTAIG